MYQGGLPITNTEREGKLQAGKRSDRRRKCRLCGEAEGICRKGEINRGLPRKSIFGTLLRHSVF